MIEESKQLQLVALLRQVGKAHHKTFQDTDGYDPEWPMWYAGYLLEETRRLHNPSLTQSELVYWMVAADKAYRSEQPPVDWEEYYAAWFLENF